MGKKWGQFSFLVVIRKENRPHFFPISFQQLEIYRAAKNLNRKMIDRM